MFDKWENGKTQNRPLSLREDTPMSSSQNEEMEQVTYSIAPKLLESKYEYLEVEEKNTCDMPFVLIMLFVKTLQVHCCTLTVLSDFSHDFSMFLSFRMEDL